MAHGNPGKMTPSTPESDELSAIVQAPDDAEAIAITALQSAMCTLLSKGYLQQGLIEELVNWAMREWMAGI